MMISFLGVRTDTVLESSYGNMSAHKKFKLEAQKKKKKKKQKYAHGYQVHTFLFVNLN